MKPTMIFARTDEQHLLGESLSRLLEEKNEFEHRRERLGGPTPDRLALWSELAELGIVGVGVAEDCGGFGGDARTIAVVMGELGRSLAIEPFLGCAVTASRILQNCSDVHLRRSLLTRIVSGELICIPAYNGIDPFGAPSLNAIANDGGFILRGAFQCVRHADVAHSFLVAANIAAESEAQGLFLVPRDARGLRIDTYRLMDASGAGDLQFSDSAIPAECRLELNAPVKAVMQDAFEWAVVGLVSETSGIASTLNAATFGYLNARKQFGVVLASFQALQHRAADMFIAAEEINAMADLAIESMAGALSAARSATLSAAKVVADAAGKRIGHEAIQLHGGMGVSDELNVSHYARRLAVIRTELGSADFHTLRFSQLS